MRYYKGSELVVGKLYQDHEGLYIYKGYENGCYLFDEVIFDDDDNMVVVDDRKRLANELYYEDERR
jgi:hypothetical protein